MRYYAPCTLGLEEVLAGELRALGAKDVEPGRGGAAFAGDRRLGYAANLWLRSAIRVQELLTEGEVRGKQDLYDLAASIDWSQSLTLQQTLSVDASVRDAFTTDSRHPALIVKDAVVDQFRDRTGKRPDVERRDPDLPIKLVLQRRRARLYRDLSGSSLHKRGYRPIQVKSPLNEALAAGLLLLAGWDRRSPLLDPMCGSGTFPIEAALLAGDRAPGLQRTFSFEWWPDFEDGLWQELRDEAEERATAGAAHIPPIQGADRHPGALSIARKAAETAGVAECIRFSRCELSQLEPQPVPAAVFVNPPYGERVGEGDDLEQSWRDLGDLLRQRCLGAVAHVLSGAPELTRHLRLRTSRRFPVRNGPLDCRLLRYEIGAGPERS